MKNDDKIKDKSLSEISSEKPIKDDDHDIVRRVLFESVNVYELLVVKYQGPVFNLFLRMIHDRDEAEEMTQIVFIKAYEALPAFSFEHRFFSWLYRIAVNQALNELKKQRRFVDIEKIKNISEEAIEKDADKDRLLQNAIDKLKDKYKAVIVLKYFQQLSYKEVAFALNIPEKKVRSRLYDARLQLKEILERNTDYF
ncbi:MAG: RNA polymerase sigma factor [Bacteroidales bacterium]|nr:RNA polymerase sigma factor [Bacteroidales bacterium]